MVDTQLLDMWIVNSGKKRGYLAKKCGLSRQGFNNKKNGRGEFTGKEIQILCDELSITKLTDKERIFFPKKLTKVETLGRSSNDRRD